MSQSPYTARPTAALGTYPVQPYKPDGGVNMAGMMMVVGALAVCGVLLGVASHYVSKMLWLVLVFPVLIGLALGFIGTKMVSMGRVRNPLIGAAAGFLGGVLAMGVMHYLSYQEHTSRVAEIDMDSELREEIRRGEVKPAELVDSDFDLHSAEVLVKAIRVDSFPSYMDFAATDGVTIGKPGRSNDKGLNLGYYGTWIYWIVEVLIVSGFTMFAMRKQCGLPYCRRSDDWKRAQTLGSFAGDIERAKAGVNGGSLADIAAAQPAEAGPAQLLMHVSPTHSESEPVDLELVGLTADAKGNIQKSRLAFATWPANAVPALRQVMTPPPPPPAASAEPPPMPLA